MLIISGMVAHTIIFFQLMFPPEELAALGLDWTSTHDDEQDDEADIDSFEENPQSLLSPSEETKPIEKHTGS